MSGRTAMLRKDGAAEPHCCALGRARSFCAAAVRSILRRIALGRIALAALLIVAAASAIASAQTPSDAYAAITPIGEEQADPAAIETWINQLGAESYGAREAAQRQLRHHAMQALPAIEQRLASGDSEDPETQLRLVRLLSYWSSDLSSDQGQAAFEVLQKIARDGAMLVAVRAENSVADLAVRQSFIASERLKGLGAFIGFATVQIITSQRDNRYMLRIDDTFRGSSADLKSLRWLYDVDTVKLASEAIDAETLAAVVMIPNLRVLQLRNVSLGENELDILCSADGFETLELLYCDLTPKALDLLNELPVSGNLRLFGTGLSTDQIAALQEDLQGVEIVHGKGGFLGISIGLPSTTIVHDVTPGSAAQVAGIRPQDRLRTIAGEGISSFDDLRQQLAKYSAGEQIEVALDRPTVDYDANGRPRTRWQPMTVQVTLGEQP